MVSIPQGLKLIINSSSRHDASRGNPKFAEGWVGRCEEGRGGKDITQCTGNGFALPGDSRVGPRTQGKKAGDMGLKRAWTARTSHSHEADGVLPELPSGQI